MTKSFPSEFCYQLWLSLALKGKIITFTKTFMNTLMPLVLWHASQNFLEVISLCIWRFWGEECLCWCFSHWYSNRYCILWHLIIWLENSFYLLGSKIVKHSVMTPIKHFVLLWWAKRNGNFIYFFLYCVLFYRFFDKWHH